MSSLIKSPKDLKKILNKTIELDFPFDYERALYTQRAVRFSIAKLEKGKALSLVGWRSCREEICRAMRDFLHQGSTEATETCEEVWASPELFSKATTLLVSTADKKQLWSNLSIGLRILNYFERQAGWDQTFIRKTKPGEVLVVGDRRWHSSVPYLSLYLLLLRCLSRHAVKPKERASSYLKRLSKIQQRRPHGSDPYHWKKILGANKNLVSIMLTNHESLSKKIPKIKKYNYSCPECYGDSEPYTFGISAVIEDIGFYKEMQKRFREAMESKNPFTTIRKIADLEDSIHDDFAYCPECMHEHLGEFVDGLRELIEVK